METEFTSFGLAKRLPSEAIGKNTRQQCDDLLKRPRQWTKSAGWWALPTSERLSIVSCFGRTVAYHESTDTLTAGRAATTDSLEQ